MAKRKFNSKFYCQEYTAMAHISKVPDDRWIPCEVYGTITKDMVDTWKKDFGYILESINEEEKLKYECHSIKGFLPKSNIDKAKDYMQANNLTMRYDKYVYMHFQIPGGYLYSGWKTGRKTKIKPEDLPKSYVHLCNYKKHGYLETAGVMDIVYHPSPFHNHTFKDDFLFISYSGELPENKHGYSDELFGLCDEYVFGNDILTVINGIEKNNKGNEKLMEKIQEIKSDMVKQYNAYVDEMGATFGKYQKYINDFSELCND